MSNVIQVLESLACNPTGNLDAAVESLTPAARAALLSKDALAINALVGGRALMMCLVAPAENDEPQEEEVPDEMPDQSSDASAAA